MWGALQALDAGITTIADWAHNDQSRHTPTRTCAACGTQGSAATSSTANLVRPPTIPIRRTRRTPAACVISTSLPARTGGCGWAWRYAGPVSPVPSATPKTTRSPATWDCRSRCTWAWRHRRRVTTLQRYRLLGADVNYVHGNMLTDREFDLIAETQGTVTVTPSTDILMQFGTFPVTGPALASSKQVPTVDLHQRDMLRLATIDGARVWDLEDEIGTLTPGKQADIAVIDMRSPHLDGFGDPVAVMVLGAGPADVETVIVGGDIVKRDGKLADDHVGHALELMHAARERLRA